MFPFSVRLEEGLKIVNNVDSSKFRLFVNRICQALQSNIDTKVFNVEEEEKLLVSLNLRRDQLTLLLETVRLIYMQAACNVIEPSTMEATMKDNFKIEEDTISIFTNAWIIYGKGIVDNLKQKSIFPKQVFLKSVLDIDINNERMCSYIIKLIQICH